MQIMRNQHSTKPVLYPLSYIYSLFPLKLILDAWFCLIDKNNSDEIEIYPGLSFVRRRGKLYMH